MSLQICDELGINFLKKDSTQSLHLSLELLQQFWALQFALLIQKFKESFRTEILGNLLSKIEYHKIELVLRLMFLFIELNFDDTICQVSLKEICSLGFDHFNNIFPHIKLCVNSCQM